MPYKNREDARRQCREYYQRHKNDPEYKKKLQRGWTKGNKKRRADPEKRAIDNAKAKLHMANLRSDPDYLKKRNAQRRANLANLKETDPDKYEVMQAARRVEIRQKNKDRRAWVNSFKDRCQVCSEDANETLVFHHVDPSTKKFSLAISPASHSEKSLLAEMNKCLVLCCNCHAKAEHGSLDISDLKIVEKSFKD